MRLLSKYSHVYTPMIVDKSIKYGTKEFVHDRLRYHQDERPIVAQLAGNDPDILGLAARVCYDEYNYEEINLNLGCPAKTASKGIYGASQMLYENRSNLISALKNIKNRESKYTNKY